ncbi:dihydrodipicolinate reductase [Frankia sp. AgB1.9]|uniref:NAD(P)H-dependent amine dehydrogenase family protein n=1 Tax=unclassified Frankia TaxID=2632575 RepID=UPI0019312A03|nr:MULTISPECIES: dihydrodipicolinate reductase [unclassified Frankia]MBL7488472.1 dihydrodipicolinate reductase [Frankia sp. AgW1.1]MBL7551133.1 dihydrodipicolinate reductase [Frankia sp. AgB1.9]MBL7620841.1 dihydrodipicolinate reductase [Frankia sp. AgB1.8]
MTTKTRRPIRVVQWATGTVGAFAMRAVIEHPDLELVGARVYSAAKDGRDAGELCGLPPVGVTATRDVEAILALRPDCVLYMPESTDAADVCRLLKNGINIVTTRAEFFNPEAMERSLREAVEEACRVGGASIHATGSSPGFITEALPICVTSLVRRLDFLAIEEYANCLEGCSTEMLVQIMHFGDAPEEFAKRDVAARDEVFKHSLSLIATALGVPVDSFVESAEIALCRQDTKLRDVTIPAGSVGAQRVSVTGLRNGEPLMRFRSNWYVTTDVEPAWDLRGDGWRLTVEGDTPVDMSIDLPMPIEKDERASGRYTAHRPVNAIPYVVAAPPGIAPTTQLSQVVAKLT